SSRRRHTSWPRDWSSDVCSSDLAEAGAGWALGFTNPMAGPILVGRLGWEDVTTLRVWVRPKRLRRTGRGALRATPSVGPFSNRRSEERRVGKEWQDQWGAEQ